MNATKDLFVALAARNLHLNLFHVSSRENSADGPSRKICRSDSKLSSSVWEQVEQAFGGITGHTFDLMALDSKEVIGRDGVQLPQFSPCLSPCSQGVNLFCQDLGKMDNMSNPYVFPPFGLLGPVLKFLYCFEIPFTMVVPVCLPRPYWWPELMVRFLAGICHLSGCTGCPSGAVEVRVQKISVSSFVVGFWGVSVLRTLFPVFVHLSLCCGVLLPTEQFFVISFIEL